MALNLTLATLLLLSVAFIGHRGAAAFFMTHVKPKVLHCVQQCLRAHWRCMYPVETKDPSIQQGMCKGVLGSCARDCRRFANERTMDMYYDD